MPSHDREGHGSGGIRGVRAVEEEILMAGKFVLKSSGDQFVFNLKAGNGEIIATSERYTSKHGALNGIESVKNNAPGASIDDQT